MLRQVGSFHRATDPTLGQETRGTESVVTEIDVIEVAPAGGEVLLGLVGQQQRDVTSTSERGQRSLGQVLEESNPACQRNGVDATIAVATCTHRMVRRIAEDQVASVRFPRKPPPYVVLLDPWTCGVEVIRKTATSHRFADVERGTAPGHGIDDQSARRRVIVQGVRHDRRRDGARMRDAERSIVTKRPDIIGSRAKPCGEPIAASQVLVSRMNRFGPGVQRDEGTPGAGVARPRDAPDGAGLAVEVLASQADRVRDRGVGAASREPRAAPTPRSCAWEARTSTASPPRPGSTRAGGPHRVPHGAGRRTQNNSCGLQGLATPPVHRRVSPDPCLAVSSRWVRHPAVGAPPAIVAHTCTITRRQSRLLVVDMAGGGSTLDVCESMGHHCVAYGPSTPHVPGIQKHNIRKGFPREANGSDLIFCDPPYRTIRARCYGDGGVDTIPLAGWIAFLDTSPNCVDHAPRWRLHRDTVPTRPRCPPAGGCFSITSLSVTTLSRAAACRASDQLPMKEPTCRSASRPPG